MPKPFRFGVAVSAATGAEIAEQARRAEALGCATLATSDHLDLSGAHVSRLSPLQLLAAAAMVTSDLRLTTQMLNQDLRHPAVLAREAASLQLLSGERFELGIGAGWNQQEYDWAGITFDPVGVRIDRLEEYLEVVRRLLVEDEVTFEGRFFRISGMPGHPRAAVAPPPLFVGGGRKRILSLAARTAHIVSIILFTTERMGPAELDERIGWIAAAAGDRLPEIELSLPMLAVLPGDGDPLRTVNRARAERSAWGLALASALSPEQVLESPLFLVGTPAKMAEDLLERRERWGVSYVTFAIDALEAMAPVIAELAGR